MPLYTGRRAALPHMALSQLGGVSGAQSGVAPDPPPTDGTMTDSRDPFSAEVRIEKSSKSVLRRNPRRKDTQIHSLRISGSKMYETSSFCTLAETRNAFSADFY